MRRLETTPRSSGVETGLAARVHDPLWLLARQWQLGEFRAEDAASPAYVDAVVEAHRIDRWRPGSAEGWQPYAVDAEPLEEVVEREARPGAEPRLRLAGGLRLRQLLEAAGIAPLVDAFRTRCPFPSEGAATAPVPGSLAAAVRARLPDGGALPGPLARLADPATAAEELDVLGIPADAGPPLAAVAVSWLAWWLPRAPGAANDGEVDGSTRPPAVAPGSWDEHRLEHRFDLGSTTLAGTVLRAGAYQGGHLDWWSVDAVADDGPAGDGGAPLRRSLRAVPSPARFGGMPVPRFWEMEDARFDPGGIDAAPNDLGRLMLAAFVTVQGNDWFVLPVRLPIACLVRMATFTVHDVFGRSFELGRAGAADDGWNLFGTTVVDAGRTVTGERPTSEWSVLAPGLADVLESAPIETVLLLRDEMANLGWAVESRVVDDAGAVVDRAGADLLASPAASGAAGGVGRYRVQTDVPAHWYPLAAEPLEDRESVRLRLVPLARGGRGAPTTPLPLGALLETARREDGVTLWVHEEEVPRAGLSVVRTWHRARWLDGSVRTWVGRRATTGAGEASSGLRFDVVEPG